MAARKRSYLWNLPYHRRVGDLIRIRPAPLGFVFGTFFVIVAYLAWRTARLTPGPWYSPAISQVVYQTTLVGSVLILAGLCITAAFLPLLFRSSSGLAAPRIRSVLSGNRSDAAQRSRPPESARMPDGRLGVEDFLDESENNVSRYTTPRRTQQAPSVSTAWSPVVSRSESTATGALMNRLSGIRARSAEAVSGDRQMGQTLRHLVEEMKPLLIAAKKAGLDVQEVQTLVAQATAGRERDLPHRLQLAEQMKGTLESALSDRIVQELQSVLGDIERARAATTQAHGAELTVAEAVGLLDTGNFAAAFDRAMAARNAFERQMNAVPAPVELMPASTSFGPFVGPSVVAAAYAAIAAMLLPGVSGFLEWNFVLNTTAILFLSYSWIGLVLYVFLSIYIAARPPAPPALRVADDFFDDDL